MTSKLKIAFIARLGLRESRALKLIGKLLDMEYDLILLGGDGTPDPNFIVRLYKSNNAHSVLIVSGDEDDILITKRARDLGILLDGRMVTIKGITVAGISGLQPHQDINRLAAEGSQGKKVNILVTHFPPYSCLNEVKIKDKVVSIGLRNISKLINTYVKDIILFTHTTVNGACFMNNRIYIGLKGGLGEFVSLTLSDGKLYSFGFRSP